MDQPKEIADAFMDAESMLEVTLHSGAKAIVSNIVVGGKGATRVIWVGKQKPTEEDIQQATLIVQNLVRQVGGKPGTPVRFHTKDEMEKITAEQLGGGKG